MNEKEKLSLFTKREKTLQAITISNERELAREYANTLRTLRHEISLIFENYADEKGLVTREVMMKYGRLTKLEEQLLKIIKDLTSIQFKITKSAIRKSFEESYYFNAFMIEKEINDFIEPDEMVAIFGLLAQEEIDSVLSNDMSAVTFKESIQENNTVLVRQIKQELVTGFVQGYAYAQIAKNVTKRMDIGYSKAVRIVQTEAGRASASAQQMTMERAVNMGIKMKKRWLSTLDTKTRRSHQKLDGQEVDVDDYFKLGSRKAKAPKHFGVAEEDINCRCTMISIIEGAEPTLRRMRDKDGKNKVVKYKNYDEYKSSLNN